MSGPFPHSGNSGKLVHPFKTADNQPVSGIIRWQYANTKGYPRLMMSDKRTCRRSSGNGLQHRGFHLQIPFGIEEIPDSVDHPGTFHKDFLDLRIHDQVEITLAVTLFGIGKGIEHLAFLLFHNRRGRNDFDNMVNSLACTEISPVCVRNTNPFTPTMSPISINFLKTVL